MAELRSTQRVPLRCTECAQRRVKCDKKAPCGRCIANFCAHLCVREVVRVRGKPTVATQVEDDDASLARQNSRLRERVTELELALTMSLRGGAGARLLPIDDNFSNKTGSAPIRTYQATAFEEVGTILDEWNLGLLKHEELRKLSLEGDLHFIAETLRCVPEKSTSTRIVEFSLQMLGWMHCALRADRFLIEHDAFQNALIAGTVGVLHDHKWMAIYFSVLAVGLFFMSDEDTLSLKLPVVGQSPHSFSVSYHWYRAALLQLDYSDIMGKPQLHTVQVAAILTLCHSHFGQRYRDINLLSVAHHTARALQMHRLGSESSYPKGVECIPEWAEETGRELGRRLWCTLVICDWLAGPRFPASIPSDSFDCVLSMRPSDYSVILGRRLPSEEAVVLSPLLHQIGLARLSQLLHEYVQSSNGSPAALSEFFDQLDVLEDDFVSKADRLSASYGEGAYIGQQVPVWVEGQRSHFLCSINFIRLIVCRILLQQSLSQLPTWSEIRTCGMRAALAIVHMQNVPPPYQLLWVFGSATIAAGVFLCLDLLTSPQNRNEAQIHEQRASVEICIAALQKYSYKSTICQEGSKILQRLLNLEINQHARPLDRDGLARLIKSMADLSKQGSRMTTIYRHNHSSWPALIVNEASNFRGEEEPSIPTLASSFVPEMANVDDPLNPYWLMDNIIFPE